MKILAIIISIIPIFSIGQIKLVEPISVGSHVPDLELHNIINYKSPSARLSDFKGKLLILDFFATWCGSCIKELPRLEGLQNQFGDQLQILVVAQEPADRIMALRQRNKRFASVKLPIVTADSVLQHYFPHRMVPHEVWIDGSGRVRAITSSEEVTEANILALLKGKEPVLRLKKDVMDFDRDKPLLAEGNGDPAKILYQSLFTGYMEGLFSGGGSSVNKDSTRRRFYFINRPVLALYASALGRSLGNRIVLEGMDGEHYLSASLAGNAFCYELTVPAETTKPKWGRLMLQDLDRYLGLHGRLEKRLVDCWVLVSRSKKALLKSKGGASLLGAYGEAHPRITLHNLPLSALVKSLNFQPPGQPLRPIIMDETGHAAPVDLIINAAPGDMPALRNELKRYGLDLQPAKRELEVFVLSKTADQP